MKDLLVKDGDLVIKKHDLQYVKDKELTQQKVKLVLSTNKGEWLFDENEGINYDAILIKNPNYDEILDTVREGLRQIDETFVITEYSFETVGRNLTMTFVAENSSGETVESSVAALPTGGTTYLTCVNNAKEILESGDALTAISVCHTDGDEMDCVRT